MTQTTFPAAAVMLLLLALPAAAQGPAQAPAQARPPAEERAATRPLNLKLDEALRPQPRVTFEPKEEAKEASGKLPALGDGAARALERSSRGSSERASSPFPPDTETGAR